MSKVNTSKNVGHTSKAFKTKSISHNACSLLLAISMTSLVAIYMLSLTPSVNIAHAQTRNQSSISNNASSSTTSSTNNTTAATTSSADKTGTITSIQNDPAGKPAWKLSGTWDFKSLNFNSPTFTSTFSMVKLDDSAMHKHTINDFKLAGNLTKTSIGSTYNGTTTVSMKEGPVSNVPISITMSDNGNISIIVDPKTTDNHFGNTPIEGKVTA
jgi:hypothetical protein